MATLESLKVGKLVESSGRIWRVGLVNSSRARLDPVTGVVTASPVSGRSFQTYGGSVNISPGTMLPIVDPESLSLADKARVYRLEERSLEDQMAEVASMPVVEGSGKPSLKEQNEARKKKLEELKAKKAETAAAAPKKEPKEPKACKCGCGGKTTGFFVPGHDARFKSWMLKIERGQAKPEELLTPEVQAQYKWKKTADGKGLVPTTNYKGEAHTGYDV